MKNTTVPIPENNNEFEKLIDNYCNNLSVNLQIGDKVKVKIISVGEKHVFVDTGNKLDGIVEKAEFVDDAGEVTCNEGDEIELYVAVSDENEIRLTKAFTGAGGANLLKEAYHNRVPVEGRVKEICKGGLVVDVMKRRAFCPISQIDLTYVENAADYVGQTFPFLITQFEDNGRNIVISRRILLQQEQQKATQQFLRTLGPGDECTGRITRLMPYGAFVELIPGVEGMVHISELAWSRVEKPDDIVQPGDSVQVKVIGIDEGKRPNTKKIALSMKQVTEDPWNQASEHFKEGEVLKGKVMRCAAFGVFVEIAPGIEGLVHISEMSYRRRVTKPEEMVTPGDSVNVMIKSLDIEHRKISLSIRDAAGDPWLEVPGKYAVGQTIKATIDKKERFGFFISLEPGIQGLLPRSKISASPASTQIEKLKVGDTITVTLCSIDPNQRKISLEPSDSGASGDWRQYAAQPQKSMGALGEKLKAALASKKSR